MSALLRGAALPPHTSLTKPGKEAERLTLRLELLRLAL
jgi:hypothetical protein